MKHRRELRPYGDLRAPIVVPRRPTLERTAIQFAGLGALAFIATAVLLLEPQSQYPRLASTKVDSSTEASATACEPLKLGLAACPSVIAVTSGGRPSEQTSPERSSADAGSPEETPAAETQVASDGEPGEQTSPEPITSDADKPDRPGETRTAEAQVTSADQWSEQTSPERVSSDSDSSGETHAAEAQIASIDQSSEQTSPELVRSDADMPEEIRAGGAQVASADQPSEQISPERVSSDPRSSRETHAAETQVPAPVVQAHNDIVVPVALKAVKEPQAALPQPKTGKLAHTSKSKSPAPRRRRLVRDYPSLRIGASTPMLDLARYSY